MTSHDWRCNPEDEELQRLAAMYIDRLIAGEDIEPVEIIANHPECGERILEELETFTRIGGSANTAPLGTLGDYTLRRQIGRGGMGVVYEAWQGSLDRQVALKVLPAGIAADNKAFMRFMREAKTAAQLNHQNVVSVYGMGVEQNTPYYTMELVEGETLAQVLAKVKDAEPETETPFGRKDDVRYFHNLAEAFADVADGLQHAHSKGVTHRDIKPSNLILDTDGRLRILDFGLARLEGQESLTLSGDLVGTPLYMSPEQARQKKIQIDHRTDVYSLGATMYEVVCGRPPFRGKDHADTLSQIIERDPVDPRNVNPRVPKDLETIVLKAMAKEPRERYETAEDLVEDLQRFLDDRPILARRPTTVERGVRWFRRRKRLLVALSVIALFAGSTAVLFHRRQQDERSARYRQLVSEAVAKLGVGQLVRNRNARDSAKGEVHRFYGDLEYRSGLTLGGAVSILEAIGLLDEAVDMFPGAPDAHYHLARAHNFNGDDEEAGRSVERVLRIDANFIPALILRRKLHSPRGEIDLNSFRGESEEEHSRWRRAWLGAYVAMEDGRWNDAAAAFTELSELGAQGDRPYIGFLLEVFLGRGYAHLEAKEYEMAVADFGSARALWRGSAEPGLLLGMAYLLMGKEELAEEQFDSLAARPDFGDETAHFVSGLYSTLRNCEKAEKWLERTGPGFHKALGETALFNWCGKYPEALEAGRRAMDHLEGRSDLDKALAYAHLGGACLNNRRFTEGLGYFDKALALAPDHGMIYHIEALALLSARRKDYDEKAVDVCRKALALGVEVPGPHENLILGLLRLGKPDEALRQWKKWRDTDPPKDELYYRRGEIARAQGNDEEAKEHYERALDVNPEFRYALFMMGEVCRGAKQHQKAAEWYLKAIEADPRYAAPHHKLGRILFHNLGNVERAVHHFEETIALNPTWVHWAYYDLGMVRKSQGDAARAIEHLAVAVQLAPHFALAHMELWSFLRDHQKTPRLAATLSALLDKFESVPQPAGIEPLLLQTLALGRVHIRGRVHFERALDFAREAVEKTHRRDPGALAVLAEIQHSCQRSSHAVRSLEAAMALPEAHRFLEVNLASYRKAALPDLPTFASIDTELDGLDAVSAIDRLLEDFRGVAAGDDAAAREWYLEGIRLERAGEVAGAAAKLEAAAVASRASEPWVKLVGCLRSLGQPEEAAEKIKEALRSDTSRNSALWDLWVELCFCDLRLHAADLLARFPASPISSSDGTREEQHSRARRLRDLLQKLAQGSAILINCGGKKLAVKEGEVWAEDAFFVGGRVCDFHRVEIHATNRDPIYRFQRSFPLDHIAPAQYRIPLPRGKYVVVLHFAELEHREGGKRRFGIRLEGVDLEWGFEPVRGEFATSTERRFPVLIEDGALEIDFVHEVGEPQIAAIEIHHSQ